MGRRGAKERGQEKAQGDLSKRESWDDGPEGRREEGSTWPGVVLKMSRSHWERCSLEGVQQDLERRRGSPGLKQVKANSLASLLPRGQTWKGMPRDFAEEQ